MLTYILPMDGNCLPLVNNGLSQNQVITLPITLPGSQESMPLQIQLVNPNAPDKPLTLNQVIQVGSFNPHANGNTIQLQLNQPPDNNALQLQLQLTDQQTNPQASGDDNNNNNNNSNQVEFATKPSSEDETKVVKEEASGSASSSLWQNDAFPECFNQFPMSLRQFLKFPGEFVSGKKEEGEQVAMMEIHEGEPVAAPKKKRKKRLPKPKRQKPGQVHIVTAVDGTMLFCCPECQMAYPEKEMLEHHLVAHNIERRFICDMCGAGLKRKEHLERHKLCHNPERPFICEVCTKGFKRKEHLNLHAVIHSGEKTEICPDCGKGFYRRDHLRKHVRTHLMRKVREEILMEHQMQQQQQQQQQGDQGGPNPKGKQTQGHSQLQQQMQYQQEPPPQLTLSGAIGEQIVVTISPPMHTMVDIGTQADCN